LSVAPAELRSVPGRGRPGPRDLSRFDFSDEIMLVHDILARRFN
jgi:hypothetical protein